MKLKMKLKWMALVGILLLVAQVSAEGAMSLRNQKEKVSYGIGVGLAREIKTPGIEVDSDLIAQGLKDELSGKKSPILDKEPRRLMNQFLYVAKNLMSQGIDVDLDLMIKGFKDELSGKKLLIPDRELRRMMTMVQGELKRGQEKATLVPAVDNLKKGEVFLAENKTKEGVVTLPSGLQYKILRMGDGRKPTEADTVECHYRGDPHQRDGVRQLLSPRATRNLQVHRSHPRLERGVEAHAGGVQVAALHPPPTRLRVAGKRLYHRIERNTYL